MRIFIYVISLIFSSCLHRGDKIEKEQGIVVSKTFKDGWYHRYTTYHKHYYGRDYRGRQQFQVFQEHHVDYIPPVYKVTFKCQHQKVFDIYREDVYKSLNDHDTVTIEYYNMVNNDNEIKDYDFITAYKQK